MSIAGIVLARLGIPVGLEAPAGMLLGFAADAPAAISAGFGLHLILGAWFALLYTEGFEATGCAGWSVGAAFSIVHTFASGFAVGFLPAIASASSAAHAPGLFMAHQDLAGVSCFILLHLLYGAVVGAVYTAKFDPACLHSSVRV